MEVRAWEYEEFPEFDQKVPGAVRISSPKDAVEVRYIHDVPYLEVDGVTLVLQILRPVACRQPEKKFPCLVWVQGSAWMEQDVWSKCESLGKIAEKGYVVAIVQYRHSGIAAFPAQIQDAKNAVRFLRLHAEEYGILPDQMMIGGDSSGGHTSMFCGIVKDGGELDDCRFPGVSADVKGIVNYYGSVSMMYEDGFPTTLNHHMPDSPEGRVMGWQNLKEHPQLCRKGSVECYLTPELSLAPVMICHGTKDRTINTYQSVQLYEKLVECQKDVRLYLLEGADHGGAEFWTDEMCALLDAFLRYCLAR